MKTTLGLVSLQSTRKWSGTSWRNQRQAGLLRYYLLLLLSDTSIVNLAFVSYFHHYSCKLQVVSIISITFVVISVVGMVISTMPQLQVMVKCSYPYYYSYSCSYWAPTSTATSTPTAAPISCSHSPRGLANSFGPGIPILWIQVFYGIEIEIFWSF